MKLRTHTGPGFTVYFPPAHGWFKLNDWIRKRWPLGRNGYILKQLDMVWAGWVRV